MTNNVKTASESRKPHNEHNLEKTESSAEQGSQAARDSAAVTINSKADDVDEAPKRQAAGESQPLEEAKSSAGTPDQKTVDQEPQHVSAGKADNSEQLPPHKKGADDQEPQHVSAEKADNSEQLPPHKKGADDQEPQHVSAEKADNSEQLPPHKKGADDQEPQHVSAEKADNNEQLPPQKKGADDQEPQHSPKKMEDDNKQRREGKKSAGDKVSEETREAQAQSSAAAEVALETTSDATVAVEEADGEQAQTRREARQMKRLEKKAIRSSSWGWRTFRLVFHLLWLPLLTVSAIAAGLYIGYSVIGGQPASEVLDFDLWKYLYDIVYAGG
ncbi:DNA-directed RNA polymerase subunit beta [Numidum massiliense]|uniref:DNA-directed RNA polymerase subunit beta n=1 Tax=Numidum massiliense TaxID=1522315 RepID=UPI0006D5629A|nr:DNA-directed RNA polymerase subunit beta [Numidum massiliense]